MTNRIQDKQTPQSPANSTSIEEIILKNVEEIQNTVQILSQRLGAVQASLNTTDEKLNRFDQKFNALEEKISQSQNHFTSLRDQLNGIDQRLDDFDKRFKFIANKFTSMIQQMDHLDTEFSSLKTMVLSAVDKAMKEYSNFVVEKLSLGNTIDTLRLEVDKMKAKIQRLEEVI